jgi:putative DNA primase/helicase
MIRADVYSFLDKCNKEVLRQEKTTVLPFVPNKVSVSETGEALKAIGHVVPTVEQPHWLDGRPGPNPADLICFPNGILNINSNQFTPPDPMLFTPHGVGFDYNPNAAAPIEWHNFLDQVFNGEKDQIGSLQEAFGYCLSNDVSQEKVFMLLGDKRSGKDTRGDAATIAPPDLEAFDHRLAAEEVDRFAHGFGRPVSVDAHR